MEEEGGVRTLGAGSVKSVSGGEGCVSPPQVLEALLREQKDNSYSSPDRVNSKKYQNEIPSLCLKLVNPVLHLNGKERMSFLEGPRKKSSCIE